MTVSFFASTPLRPLSFTTSSDAVEVCASKLVESSGRSQSTVSHTIRSSYRAVPERLEAPRSRRHVVAVAGVIRASLRRPHRALAPLLAA